MLLFFFFKQKTAYEMRISDWSSDVCSSDLDLGCRRALPAFSLRQKRCQHDTQSHAASERCKRVLLNDFRSAHPDFVTQFACFFPGGVKGVGGIFPRAAELFAQILIH